MNKAHFMRYMKTMAVLAAALCWVWAPAVAIASAPAPVPQEIFADPLWDDGRAEYSTYTGTTLRYGQDRALEVRMILVKEDLLRDALVKRDAGSLPGRTVTAIKLNTIADFTTGTYAYHQMTTVMCERASGAVLKETVSQTEGCGISFVRIAPKQGRLVRESHSYFESDADAQAAVEWAAGERVYADALPLWLRRYAHLTAPFARTVQLLATQVGAHASAAGAQPAPATIALVETAPVQVPAGKFDAVHFTVTSGDAVDHYWFDRAAPHVLLRMDTAAGRHLTLKKTQRLDYWNHRANGDERMLD